VPGAGFEPALHRWWKGGLSLRFRVRQIRSRPDIHVLYGLPVRLLRPMQTNPVRVGESRDLFGTFSKAADEHRRVIKFEVPGQADEGLRSPAAGWGLVEEPQLHETTTAVEFLIGSRCGRCADFRMVLRAVEWRDYPVVPSVSMAYGFSGSRAALAVLGRRLCATPATLLSAEVRPRHVMPIARRLRGLERLSRSTSLEQAGSAPTVLRWRPVGRRCCPRIV
jgi:hypothetical protein